jgi:putative spermidine/putrescine transport system permease protein
MRATEFAAASPEDAGGRLSRLPTPDLPAGRAGTLADRALGRVERFALAAVAGSALTFLLLPVAIVIPMSFSSAASLRFPPPGLSLRWYREFLSDEAWREAAMNSLLVAGVSSALAVALGTLAAYRLARGRFRGRPVLEAHFMAPLVVPPVIAAVALYIAFAKVGFLGSYHGLVLAHTVHSVPYVVLLMSVAIASFDERIEQVARTLGASEWTVFVRILLPNLLPSVAASWVLAFIASFDEVILTLFLFGNRYTIPKQMFVRLELQIDPTITAVATMLIVFSVVTLAMLTLLAGPVRTAVGFSGTPGKVAAADL